MNSVRIKERFNKNYLEGKIIILTRLEATELY